MAQFVPVDPFDLIIFGGTGDLSQRKLLPALFHRYLDEQIPESSRIIGTARSEMSREDYLDMAKTACHAATADATWSEEKWQNFAEMLYYQPLDISASKKDWKPLKDLVTSEKKIRVYYLATAPSLYIPTCEGLDKAGMVTSQCRVVLEKPIGRDLESAHAINEGVCAVFDESQIFRIDHYLGKETVQNLMVLRFSNSLFEPLWSRNHIDHVQITVAESLGLEGRAGYYDKSGALRDMVQNHILQLLCLIAMEPPQSMDADDIRTEKIKVLRALTRFDASTAKTQTVRGQYTEGLVEKQPAPGYLEELGEGETSNTETYVAIKADIANWRWAGVPFYLRTGKRMKHRTSEIVIQFKPVAHSIFGDTSDQPNRLVIRLQPDEAVRLFLHIKEPGPGGLHIKSLPLNLSYAESFHIRYPDAYERLLMEVVRGNLALFMRRDEVEAAWQWVDNLIEAWEASDAKPVNYTAGSEGPLASAMLLDRDGRSWWASDK
ncbi:MAG: glucose-6-phosphate dehydrogenase [Ponticaulis sp.]|nr:glucose-6-phosphate dehydrogenase [Ponticaulis sp.]